MTLGDAAAVAAFGILIVAIAAPDDDGPCPCPEPAVGALTSHDRQGDDR